MGVSTCLHRCGILNIVYRYIYRYIYCFFTSTVTPLLLIPTCCYLVLPVTEFFHSMNKLTLFSQIFVFCLSLNVFLPHPSPIPIQIFKVLASLHTVPKTIMSYNYITLNLVKFISLTFLWVLFLTHNVSLFKVKFVKFRLNLSLYSKCPEVIRSSSPPFQFLLYLYTFLNLFEPFFTVSCAR